MEDINGTEIQIGDMVKFQEDRYNKNIGIVQEFLSGDGILVIVCGPGGAGPMATSGEKSEIITELVPKINLPIK